MENEYITIPTPLGEKVKDDLLRILDRFVIINGYRHDDVSVDYDALSEIVMRVNEHRAFLRIYHFIDRVPMMKEIALYAYWIHRLKPFRVRSTGEENSEHIEHRYLLFYVLSCLEESHKSNGHGIFRYPTEEIVEDWVYTLRRGDVTKEGMEMWITALAYYVCENNSSPFCE